MNTGVQKEYVSHIRDYDYETVCGAVGSSYPEERDAAIKDALTKYQYGLVAVSDNGFPGGGHCIMLTGWNDAKDTYKFKNSWGETYGDKGFWEISKSKIDRVYLPLFDEIVLPFEDVKESDWFYDDVKSMYFSGMIKGTSDTTFEPNKPLTRAEACALFNRANKETDKRFDIMNKVLEEKCRDV